MRRRIFGSTFLAAMMLIPAISQGQFPGTGGPGGGFDMSKMNPDFLFMMLAKGKESVNRDELDERGQRMFDRFAPMMGITGTTITRDQFRDGMTKVAEMAKNGQLPMMGRGPDTGGPGGPGGFGGDRTEERFKQYDKNQDGVIQIDELP